MVNSAVWPPMLPPMNTPGVILATSVLSRTPIVCNCSVEKADMAMPTSCTDCSRLVAVTVISSRTPPSFFGFSAHAAAGTDATSDRAIPFKPRRRNSPVIAAMRMRTPCLIIPFQTSGVTDVHPGSYFQSLREYVNFNFKRKVL